MKTDYFSEDYNPDSLTDEQIDEAQNRAILELVQEQIIVQKDYKKVKMLYYFCVASNFFCPILIFCIYYRKTFKDSKINYKKGLAPIFISGLSAIFQITITIFFLLQMVLGNTSTESLIAYLIPSILCTFLLAVSFSFSTLFNKIQVKRFINLLEPQESAFKSVVKKIKTKITGK